MSEENKALVRRWFEEVWNKGREEAIDEMFSEEGVANGLTDEAGEPLRGASGFKPFFRQFREAFPDVRVVVEDMVAEGDKVAARVAFHGTHRGELQGIPPTGKEGAFTSMEFNRVVDGKVEEHWVEIDLLGLMQQLGAIPEPEQEGVEPSH